jgi:hypothetical protein
LWKVIASFGALTLLGFRLEPEVESGFMLVAISASRYKRNWCPLSLDPHVAFIYTPGRIFHDGGTASSQGEVFAGAIVRF